MKSEDRDGHSRRGFLAGVATAAAGMFLARFGTRLAAAEDRIQPTEPGGGADVPKLPPPKGSVKRRG